MRFTEETIMAYADGELDDSTRFEVELAMRQDPALAEKIRQHQANHDPVIVRQQADRFLDREPLLMRLGEIVADMFARLFRREQLVAPDPAAHFIDPGIFHDAKDPAVQARARFPLLAAV